MLKYIVMMLSVCFVSSCSITAGIADVENNFMYYDMTKEQLILSKGIPDNSYKTENGIEILEYYGEVRSNSVYDTTPVFNSYYTSGSTYTYQKKTRYFLKNGVVIDFRAS